MVYVIICEGKTDSVVINHYMTAQGFNYIKEANIGFEFKLLKKQSVDYFKNGTDILAIWNVGGSGNIKFSIEQIEELVSFGNEINSLAIVTDMDTNLSQTIEADISSYFKNTPNLKDNVWDTSLIKNSYGEDKKINVLLTIIPKAQSGALETIMLDALENIGYEEKILVDEVKKFIDNLNPLNLSFLDKVRKIIKSKLGCTVNIIDPERTFFDIIPAFNTINWSQFPIIQSHFNELMNYK